MTPFYVRHAVLAVCKNLDELAVNSSQMLGKVKDTTNREKVIEHSIPEAINAVHMQASVELLEGLNVNQFAGARLEGKVLTFIPKVDDFLRLVAFRASDSSFVISEPVLEDSTEGRMQLNPYVCGEFDNPKLVLLQGEKNPPAFRYYSTKEVYEESEVIKPVMCPRDLDHVEHYTCSVIKTFRYLPVAHYSDQAISYPVAAGLDEAVINYLTGITLQTYRENEHAQVFIQRALAQIQ